MSRTPQNELHGRQIISALRRHGRLSFPALCQETMLEDQQVRAALRFVNRNLDPLKVANEIVAVAQIMDEHVYFIAPTGDAADVNLQRRLKITGGHIDSCIYLEKKAQMKWPSPQRTAGIRMMEMARELLITAPGAVEVEVEAEAVESA